MIEVIITAVLAFASTNIDDLFILMMLFSQASGKNLTPATIFAGQYLGISTLIILSLAGSLLGIIIPLPYIGLLGFLPVYLGLSKIYHHIKKDHTAPEEVTIDRKPAGGFLASIAGINVVSIAAITIANGGDNIGLYIPLFANLTVQQLVITIIIFLVLVYVWLITARYLISHPRLKESISRYKHIIFPVVLIALGVYILMESGTINLLSKIH